MFLIYDGHLDRSWPETIPPPPNLHSAPYSYEHLMKAAQGILCQVCSDPRVLLYDPDPPKEYVSLA